MCFPVFWLLSGILVLFGIYMHPFDSDVPFTSMVFYIFRLVVTHRGDPAAWCAGSGGKYRELVLEGNQGRLKK